MLKRYGTAAHLVNALSFALAQLLIAGINLYLLGKIMNWLLGWPLWVGLIVAAVIGLLLHHDGGLSAAIYNEVLQFFVIVAALLPLTLIGLHRVGGWQGLTDKITDAANLAGHPTRPSSCTPGPATRSPASTPNVLSVIGLVFGLGFVLSFGYWTTNFVEGSGRWPRLDLPPSPPRSSAPSSRCSCPPRHRSGHGRRRPGH
ncbi:Predicted symporter [Actinomyces viscosus]|uniref:Predicted symporter n=2 Tax=Actinomyces viscosus TaxID=1656 RepID=A0A448PQ55_ACTVI|nr:Predicted symporter [Actinomyces viscosus]